MRTKKLPSSENSYGVTIRNDHGFHIECLAVGLELCLTHLNKFIEKRKETTTSSLKAI